jgi:hypothetical protein
VVVSSKIRVLLISETLVPVGSFYILLQSYSMLHFWVFFFGVLRMYTMAANQHDGMHVDKRRWIPRPAV